MSEHPDVLRERIVALTQEFTQLVLREQKIMPLNRASIKVNLIGLAFILLSFLEAERFALTWQIGMTLNWTAILMIVTVHFKLRPIRRRADQINAEMHAIVRELGL